MAKSAFLHPFARPNADSFINIVSGSGSTVYDKDGTAYIDAMASLWYCQVGHGRSEIVSAVSAQMEQLEAFHAFEMFTNPPAEQLCQMLADRAPMQSRVFLTDSGSEAVETALKFARLFWTWQDQPDRHVVISRDRAYHGVGYGGTSAQGLPLNKEGWGELLGDVHQVDAENLAKMEAAFAQLEGRVAAVIVEPLQGAAGVYPPPLGYLKSVRQLCDRHGALLIFDEVISGFGRLGTWWAADHYDVIPDMITFAKGVTSGYLPLGGVLVGKRVTDVFESDQDHWIRHGFTYSGHPTVAACAIANISLLESDGLLSRAIELGSRLKVGLDSLCAEKLVRTVRGDGAVWAVDLPEGVSPHAIRDTMVSKGVIPRPIGVSTLAFCPPLVITDTEIDQVLEITRASLMELARS